MIWFFSFKVVLEKKKIFRNSFFNHFYFDSVILRIIRLLSLISERWNIWKICSNFFVMSLRKKILTKFYSLKMTFFSLFSKEMPQKNSFHYFFCWERTMYEHSSVLQNLNFLGSILIDISSTISRSFYLIKALKGEAEWNQSHTVDLNFSDSFTNVLIIFKKLNFEWNY